MEYYVKEKQNSNSTRTGYIIKAESLSSAKRQASKRQFFQHPIIQISYPGENLVISEKKWGIWTDNINFQG